MSDLQDYLNDPARDGLVVEVRKKIDALEIDAIYYQYISITGRIMGKMIPVQHWERAAREGMQTWIGGIANVFADKDGNLIGFPPNASELLALPDPETFCQLPWNKRIARVFCTVFFSREDPGPSRRIPRLGFTGKSAARPRRIPAGSRRPAHACGLRARNAVAEAG